MKLESGQGGATLWVNGQEIGRVENWSFDIKQDAIDVTPLGGAKRYVPGLREVTITLDGVFGFGHPSPPRGDIVTHSGTICCCRHCPEGGKHE